MDDPVAAAEALARSLHLADGERRIELAFHEGRLRRADLHLGPLKPEELRNVVRALKQAEREGESGSG